jgi:hypothetical protein
MRMNLAILSVAAALCGVLPVFAGPLIELSEGMTAPIAAHVETFENGRPARYAGSGRTVIGTFPISSAPENDNTVYYSVQPGTAAFVAEPGVGYNYFGLYWGTIDEYNQLRFFRDGRLIAMVTGRDVLRLIAARGTPSSKLPSCYVNIHFGAETFTRVEFRTSIPAFESDNHAFAKVAISEADAL